jgi:hypothetical protein
VKIDVCTFRLKRRDTNRILYVMNMLLIMIVLPFLLVMSYQVRWLFHMIRTTQ